MPTQEAAGRLFVSVIRGMKMLQAAKARAARVHPAVESASYPILFSLSGEPQRVSALADLIHSDVSTVSRQVTHLAKAGLIAKVTDPADGRAQLISITPEGSQLVETLRQKRAAWLAGLLEDWTPEEIAQFTAYLDRFADALQDEKLP
ncbi:MarR family winged helix-turn-helix transcriptional regulator [Actinomycetota bacterium]|nr:MarR family transcriptional regulator [Micrococcales bacterium]